MDLNQIKDLIKSTTTSRNRFARTYLQNLKYYKNENDITAKTNGESETRSEGKTDPLRHADNRVSNNYYRVIVDQEAAYVATVAPQIDVGSDQENEKIISTLGDGFALTVHNLVIDAACAGRGWLHYWIDNDKNFRYGIISPDQITPIFDTTLDNKLVAVLRSYKKLDTDTGKYFLVREYWTKNEVYYFKEVNSNPIELENFNIIKSYDASAGFETGTSNVFRHNFGRVPFIGFTKNHLALAELHKIKGLIDAYDKVYNGFLNDIDDIQQVVIVLKNYSGTNLQEFMEDLRKKKAIKFNNAGAGDQSGVDTLQIEIPTEARKTVLDLTKNSIFLQAQGIDPANFKDSNASGVAIKMLYSHLELKASSTEANFRRSITELVRAIMRYLNFSDADGRTVTQTWTRTQVEDSLTKAQTVATVANYTSKEAIARANPLVDDWQQELADQKQDIEHLDGFKSDYEDQDLEIDSEGLGDE